MPVIRHGGGGERDRPRVRLPALRRSAVRSGAAGVPAGVRRAAARRRGAGWVQASIEYALERAPSAVEREPERRRDAPAGAGADRGAAAAPRDARRPPTTGGSPRCAIRCSRRRSRCCTARPERTWTVAELAAGAAVSRSLLDERFRQVLGRSPIRYLTEWRMHLAEELLATTEHRRRRDRPPGRLRLRGGVQPGVQARTGRVTQPLAGDHPPQTPPSLIAVTGSEAANCAQIGLGHGRAVLLRCPRAPPPTR